MQLKLTQTRDLLRAAAVGVAVAVGTGLVTAPRFKAGIAPMPEAPSLAFAKTLFGPVSDAVGHLFDVLRLSFGPQSPGYPFRPIEKTGAIQL